MDKAVTNGLIKALMMKESLASYQIEGIGLDLTLEDLYLAELGHYRSEKKRKQITEITAKTGTDKGGKE